MKLTSIKLVMIYFLFTSLSGCSPKISSQLFYNYKKSNDGFYEFKGRWYSVIIQQEELDSLPKLVKQFLGKSNMVGHERVEELFFHYGGTVRIKGYTKIKLSKHFRITEHTSTLEPRFSAVGKSFPIKAHFDLFEDGKIKIDRIGFNLKSNKNNFNEEEMNDIFTLKYLSLMVWYPSAFLNDNIHWSSVITNNEIDKNSIMIAIQEEKLEASGQLFFDSISSMPVSFVGFITTTMEDQCSLKKFEISYSNFKDIDSYYIPKKCVAKIEDDEEREIRIEMNFNKYKMPDQKKIFGKKGKNEKEKR